MLVGTLKENKIELLNTFNIYVHCFDMVFFTCVCVPFKTWDYNKYVWPDNITKNLYIFVRYAPESLRDGKFSTRSDVWSYGVTLFEMFSLGEDPQLPALVEKSTDQALLLAALDSGSRLPCPGQCPQNIYVTLISPCWSHESHSRPTFTTICHTITDLQKEFYPLSSF